jgi:hypothetical protein
VPAEPMAPFQQGHLDSLCGLYAAINAMGWATRHDNIEDAFWGEVFDSLVLCTDAHVGMAHVLITGIGPAPLTKVLKEAFAGIELRFGRRFTARRPLRGLSSRKPDCVLEQLAWFTEQPDLAAMLIVKARTRHWTTLKEVDGQRLLLIDSSGRTHIAIAGQQSPKADRQQPPEADDDAEGRISRRSVIVIERVR